MKHTFFKLLTIALVITLSGCKKEIVLSEFKYSEKGIVLNCDKFDLKLLNEAVFSFENDIEEHYSKNNQKNLTLAYSQFVRNAVNNRVKYEEITSLHTLAIFEVLKSKSNLWNLQNANSKLNYTSDVFNCISTNIQNNDLKTTLNALITTNSMSPKLFGAPLNTGYRSAVSDKYLAAYIAFDLFYAKLFDVDPAKVVAHQNKQKKEIPSPTKEISNDPHAGHNH